MDATIDDRLPPRSLVIIGAKIVQCKQPFFLRVESETTTHNVHPSQQPGYTHERSGISVDGDRVARRCSKVQTLCATNSKTVIPARAVVARLRHDWTIHFSKGSTI
ncbi:hypothetical protein ISCGN_021748 [Ixodes scapularis]